MRDVVDISGHLYPVGRLDFESECLVLMTNDGDLTGLSRYEAGDYEVAIERFKSTLQLEDTSPLIQNTYILLLAGNNHLFLDENNEAVDYYNQMLQLTPKISAAYFNRAIAFAKLGQYDKAVTDYTTTIQLPPNNSAAYLDRADAYANLGQFDNAVTDYTIAIQRNPDDERAYFYRATLYQKAGKTAEAEADFKKYEELTGQKP